MSNNAERQGITHNNKDRGLGEEKIVVIHQPDFIPYLGFFHRFLHADLWVILDNVQFVSGSKGCWHNRDRIKTMQGAKWLTVAVKKCQMGTKINEVLLSRDVDWKESNLNLLKYNYREAPFFDEIFPYIEELYAFECKMLVDFNLRSIDMLKELFDIKIEFLLSSTLKPEGRKNELLVEILKKVNATTYLSGLGAKDYFEAKPFDEAGIEVQWQDFKHPIYKQLYGEFVPYLSAIDLLFNCGTQKSRKILRSC